MPLKHDRKSDWATLSEAARCYGLVEDQFPNFLTDWIVLSKLEKGSNGSIDLHSLDAWIETSKLR